MVDNDMPGAWPVWTPGAPLAAFIKESIIESGSFHPWVVSPGHFALGCFALVSWVGRLALIR